MVVYIVFLIISLLFSVIPYINIENNFCSLLKIANNKNEFYLYLLLFTYHCLILLHHSLILSIN